MKRILIVGGGSAGWMVAAYLNRFLGGPDRVIILLESIKIETSGIGESAAPALVKFVRGLRLDENEFMRQCSATYKVGAKFVNWMGEGTEFWHPYGSCGTINNIDLFQYWLRCSQAGRHAGAYSSFSLQALVGERDQSPRPLHGPSPIIETGAYGYHLDMATCADYLREVAVAEGVNHLFDDVREVVLGASGAIERLETKSGRTLAADLYIDCSGRGELIEQGLGDPWVDWSATLLCDRSVLLPLPRDPRVPPYTKVTALSAGWMWQMSLSHRVASGYVYSSRHLADEAAVRELVAHASPHKAAAAEPRLTKWRSGRRQNFWRRNCVALGPAAGVLEPLQATDTLLLHKNLELLVEYFPDATLNPVLIESYNRRITAQHDGARDFLLLHYLLSLREGDPFWRDSRSVSAPARLQAVMDLHAENGIVEPEWTTLYPEASFHHLFAAGKRLPRRPCAAAAALELAKIEEIFAKMRAQNEHWLARLPSHREVMDALHKPPV